MHPIVRALAAGAAGGTAALLWGLAEARHGFTVRTHTIETRTPRPLTILHISDLHLTRRDRPRVSFVRSLAALKPDFVVLTGDNFGDPTGPATCTEALQPLLELPGAFVFGSHDYVSGAFKSPIVYFGSGDEPPTISAPDLPAEAFADTLVAAGWTDLNNARTHVVVNGLNLALVGVNDPHVGYDRYPEPDADHGDLQLALLHAPYTRVLDSAWNDGSDLALAGHTHGGQVCVPFYGALVNNADIPTWRASGLQGWPGLRPDGELIEPRRLLAPYPREQAKLATADPSRPPMWLNISAGVGTSPHAPVRFACRPEVSLLHLLPHTT
ncbi:MAG: metallophosphoesterase [Ruaniaceae bacterium]|nr:metallophosphoesterase [Ruaniaceae bacterium]